MEAVASFTDSESLCTSTFNSMSQRIMKYLRQPEVHLIGVHGWNGVGRQQVIKHVVETLETISDGKPKPFTRILWLSEDEGLDSTISKRIQEVLQTERDDAGETFRMWWEPLNLPQYAMLVIIDDLQHPINLQQVSMGQYPTFIWPVKVLFSSGNHNLITSLETSPIESWTLDSSTHAVGIYEQFINLSEMEAWTLLWHEAEVVADKLPRQEGVQCFSQDVIMECFLYCTLFPGSFFASQYWLSEGLLSLSTSLNLDMGYSMFDLLINSLRDRNMIRKLPSSRTSTRMVEIATPLAEKVRTIATTLHPLSSSSAMKKNGVFIVEIAKDLEEFPAMERCDHEEITRVSLAKNSIKRLQLVPVCFNNNNILGGKKDGLSGGENIHPNLSTLILSYNAQLQEIKDDFFNLMPNLRVLDLSFTGLLTLPPSLTSLNNLRLLTLYSCTKLETISPCIEKGFQNLEMLDLGSCPLPKMTRASFQQVCNLRILFLNGASFQKLEELDLSHTRIEEFPKVSRMANLTRLDLLNTRHLFYVNWKNFTRLPPVITWDQCESGSLMPETGGPRICVKNADIFKQLRYDSPLWSQCFREFYISISPWTKLERVKHVYSQVKHPSFPYTDVFPQIKHCLQPLHPPPIAYNRRHLQIYGGTSPFTDRLKGVIPYMESLHLCDHESVKSLPVSYSMELKQCKIHKCRSMETIFHGTPAIGYTSKLPNLELMHLFHLTRLKTIYEGEFGIGSFAHLRHVHIDSCPKMVVVFSSPDIVLEQLEVLVIKFCGKLHHVFGRGSIGQKVAPALKELCLWDLQELRNICHGHLQSLRVLKLKGCAKLQTLPLPPVDNEGKPLKLEITAEQKWWENLDAASKKNIVFRECSP